MPCSDKDFSVTAAMAWGQNWRILGNPHFYTHRIHGYSMVYLPTFGCFLMGNVGKYSVPDMEHMGYTSPGEKNTTKTQRVASVLGETIFINFLSQWWHVDHVEQNLSSNVRWGLEASHNEHLVDDVGRDWKVMSTQLWGYPYMKSSRIQFHSCEIVAGHQLISRLLTFDKHETTFRHIERVPCHTTWEVVDIKKRDPGCC